MNNDIQNIAELGYNLAISGGNIMPIIKSSADLRNNYSKVSKLCHENNEPIFITKNGKGDLAIMSMEVYDALTSKYRIYNAIDEGLKDIENGNTMEMDDAIKHLKKRLKDGS